MHNFDFIENQVFDERTIAFAPQDGQALPGPTPFTGIPIDTGTKVYPNGDIEIGFYAPNAREVQVVFGIRGDRPYPMTKREDGVWKMYLEYDPMFKGPKAFHFSVDGAEVVSPYCEQYYSHSKAINYVEIPDPDATFVLMQDVPHGAVTTEYYWSHAQNTWQRCLVYTPPMYHEGGDYPVLYLQHGYGENETSWIYNAKVHQIMDNLIAEGKATPFIIVMNNNMIHADVAKEMERKDGGILADNILKDCLPMIERKYRVKKDKWSRAIAGFSMGSMQSCVIALTHPDLFSYVGLFSGFMRYLNDDTSYETNQHLKLMDDRERFINEFKLFYRSMGSEDFFREFFNTDDKICKEHGYDQYPNYVRHIAEGYPHDWSVLRILFHDFAQRIFRE